MRKKVTVVGGGFVGSTTAQRIVDRGLADVVLTDILEGVPAGRALDMLESTPITRADARALGISTAAGDYKASANSDIVVITAGFPRKPGMSRDDLLRANYDVVKGVVEAVVKLSPNAILIMVTNPLDAMVQAAYKISGFPKNRVMGMAGVLDSARMSSFVAMELNVSVEKRALLCARRTWRRHGCPALATPTWPGSRCPTCCPRRASTPSWTARATAARKLWTC